MADSTNAVNNDALKMMQIESPLTENSGPWVSTATDDYMPVGELEPFCESSGQIGMDSILGKRAGDEFLNVDDEVAGVGDNLGTGAGAKDGWKPGGGGGRGRGGRGGGGDDPDGFSAENVDPTITLASIGGLGQHISYLRLAVMYPIRHGEGLKRWGMEPPKGIMFHGPPGTGKTMLAKALCNEISTITGKKVSFFYHKGTESMGMYFGETEARLRQLFAAAVAKKPSIIFFDEIDGLCPNRERAAESTQAYVTIVTALLGLIDSVQRGDVLIIGATNRLNAIDPAIRRPGRFDKELYFPLPDEEGRKNILLIHTSEWAPVDKPTTEFLTMLAKRTTGFTGADLSKLCVDTCQTALIRCGSAYSVRIIQGDWESAFCAMNRSSTNVFGSSLYVADPIQPLLKPLFDKETGRLVCKAGNFLPDGDLATQTTTKIQGRQTFLVWDQIGLIDNYHLNTLMKSFLSHPALNKYPIYILDIATITKLHSEQRARAFTGIVDDVIGQVVNSSKPCILYIPGINVLHEAIGEWTKEKSGSLFVSLLKKITGSQKLILASWIGPKGTCPELEQLFWESGTLRIRQPSSEEMTCFFNQLFPSTGRKQNEVKFVKELVQSVNGNELSGVVDLFAKLSRRKEDLKLTKKKDFLPEFRVILNDYRANC